MSRENAADDWFAPPPGRRRRDWKMLAVIAASILCILVFGNGLRNLLRPRELTEDEKQLVRHRAAADPAKTRDNFEQLSRATSAYRAKHGGLPADIVDAKTGKPLLSWRVALLPDLGEAALHGRFRLAEPWDSPHNTALLAEMPAVFAHPRLPHTPATHTHVRFFRDPSHRLDVARERVIGLIAAGDAPARAVGLIETAAAVPWTEPDAPAAQKPIP